VSARTVSWLSPARKDFEQCPERVRDIITNALAIAAEGGKAAIAKPLHGLGSGVIEIRCRFHRDAYRAVYALHAGEDVWVVHVFTKKSHRGIATPLHHVELVASRLKRLSEILRHGWD